MGTKPTQKQSGHRSGRREREPTSNKKGKKKMKHALLTEKKAWNTTENKKKAANIYLRDCFCTALSSSSQSITEGW